VSGFRWDSINFQKKPGGDNAGLTQTTKQIGYSIPSDVMLTLEQGDLEGAEVSRGLGACWASDGESCSVHSTVCFMYSPSQYYCCYYSLPLLFC